MTSRNSLAVFQKFSCAVLALLFVIATNTAFGRADKPVDAAMKNGYEAAQQQDYLSAIRYFEEAHVIAPKAAEIYYNLGLAESKLPGRELRAIAWFGAYLTAMPDAPVPKEAAVKEQMGILLARNKSNLSRFLQLVEAAASQIFSTLGDEQGEELSYRGDIQLRDKKSKNMIDAARLWAESGDSDAALKTAGNFRREEYYRNALDDIAEAQAATGNISGAQLTAEILREPNLKSSIQSSIVEAHVRSGDIVAAQRTFELMPNGVSREWAHYAITNGKPMVPGRYDRRDAFPYGWLLLLDDNDRSHNCPLNSAPFLDLSGYLKSLPSADDPQMAFDALRDTADGLVMAQVVISRMLKQQAVLPSIQDSPEQEKKADVVSNAASDGTGIKEVEITTKASLPTARWAIGLGGINGVIYVAGGYNPALGGHLTIVEAYDVATNTWSSKGFRPGIQTGATTGVINGVLYVAGGSDCCVNTPSLTAYTAASNSWSSRTAPSSSHGNGPAGGVIGGLFYVAGGGNQSNNGSVPTLEVYDPMTNTWATKAPMPTARQGVGSAVLNDMLYVVGGTSSARGTVGAVEAYDPTTNTWTTKAPLPTPRSDLIVAVLNGILYAVGGSISAGPVSTVEAYDPATNTWSTMDAMPTARTAAQAVVVNGKLYVIGGYLAGGATALSTVEAFTPGKIKGIRR